MDDVHFEVPFDELRSYKLYKVLKNPTDMPSGFPKVDQMFKVVDITPDRRYVTIMAVPPRGDSELMMQMEHNTYPERSFVLMNPPAAAAAGGRRRRSRRARRRTQSRRRY
jgi:hypothetical protein